VGAEGQQLVAEAGGIAVAALEIAFAVLETDDIELRNPSWLVLAQSMGSVCMLGVLGVHLDLKVGLD